jgi:hypothetical protein
MYVYTYFEECGVNPNAGWLLGEWAENWRQAGFEPVVLGDNDARKHPKYRQWVEVFKSIPTTNHKCYELACYKRWLAMAVCGGFMVDYDVFQVDMVPFEVGPLTFYNRYHIPCAVSGTPDEFERMLHWFRGVVCGVDDNVNGVPHLSDMLICTKHESELVREWVAEYLDPISRMVHFSNRACRLRKRESIMRFRLEHGAAPKAGNLWTVVITAHARPDLLRRAFQSCKDAEIPNVVITATGINKRLEAALSECEGRGAIVIRHKDNTTSNASWLAGVEAAKTEFVTILHDDDAVVPNILDIIGDKLSSRVDLCMWSAGYLEAHEGVRINEMLLTTGRHKSRLIRLFLDKNSLAISPVRGFYRRIDAAAALRESEGLGSEFMVRPDFMVGNDMLLWLRLSERNPWFWWENTPCVALGCAESTTFKNLTTSHGSIMRFYDRARAYYHDRKASATDPRIEHPDSMGIVCYIPDKSYPGVWKFIENINSVKTKQPILFYSDQPWRPDVPGEFVEIQPATLPDPLPMPAKDVYGAMYWLQGIRLARARGFDYALILEADCRVTKDWWDETIFNEFFDWPHAAVCGGTPVCWHPWSKGEAWSRRVIDYAHAYQQRSNVMMAIEGDHGHRPILYPNGALAVYDTEEARWMFPNAVDDPLAGRSAI